VRPFIAHEGDEQVTDTQQLLEAQRASAGIHSLRVMSANIHGKSSKGTPKYRKDIISQWLKAYMPDIFLVQEQKWANNSFTDHISIGIDGYVFHPNSIQGEVGIYYNRNYITAEVVQIPNNLENAQSLPHRMLCLKMTVTDQHPNEKFQGKQFLVAAFHGLYKTKTQVKDLFCTAAINWLAQEADQKGIAAVIGGDFNYNIQDFDILHVWIPKPHNNSPRRGEQLDFVVVAYPSDAHAKKLTVVVEHVEEYQIVESRQAFSQEDGDELNQLVAKMTVGEKVALDHDVITFLLKWKQ